MDLFGSNVQITVFNSQLNLCIKKKKKVFGSDIYIYIYILIGLVVIFDYKCLKYIF